VYKSAETSHKTFHKTHHATDKEGVRLVDQYFDQVGDAYLRHSEEPAMEVLRAWRPKLFSLTLLNPYYAGFVGVHRKRIGVGKDKIVWLEMGNPDKPPLLLLHGFSAAKEHWMPLLPFFAGDFRVLMLDLPGWGESGFNPETVYGLQEQADRVQRWLGELGLKRVHVVGNSMGGAIAGIFSARHPSSVLSLTLMDALGLPGEEHTPFVHELLQGHNRLIPKSATDVLKLTDLVFHNRALAASAAFFSATELIHRKDVNSHLFRMMLSHRPNFNEASFEDISAPTLVMWGSEDKVLHPSSALTFTRVIKRAELCMLKAVGHLPMIESPYLCAQAIKAFVGKHT